MTIAVLGESVIDCVLQEDGTLAPSLGGSLYNVARALGRQNCKVCYLSPISTDLFGGELVAELDNSGVDTSSIVRSRCPSSIAIIRVDEKGQPVYSLYREGVADRDYPKVKLYDNCSLLHTGSLALVAADAGYVHSIIKQTKKRGALISVDLNLRPGAVTDMNEYRQSIRSILPHCDIIKASDEDLCALEKGRSPRDIAASIFHEYNAAIVILTLGEKGAIAFSSQGEQHCESRKPRVVVDTIGAGDCFHANFIAALEREGLLTEAKRFRQVIANLDPSVIETALQSAAAAATFNIEHAGCCPPNTRELKELLRE